MFDLESLARSVYAQAFDAYVASMGAYLDNQVSSQTSARLKRADLALTRAICRAKRQAAANQREIADWIKYES